MTLTSQQAEVTVTGMHASGAGIALVEGRPVIVPGAIAGERIRMTWRPPQPGGRQGLALSHTVLEASPHENPAPCPHAGRCGGCPLGRLEDDFAAALKRRELVVDELIRAGLTPEEAEALTGEVLRQPADASTGFRNKAILYPCVADGRVRFGFFRAGTHEVVPAEDCPQAPAWTGDAARLAARAVESGILTLYDERTDEGTLRALLMREGSTGERQVTFVLRRPLTDDATAALAEAMAPAGADSLCTHLQPKRGNAILSFAPGATTVIAGRAEITTRIGGLTFGLRPETFLQVNTPQTEVLYRTALDALELSAGEMVLDLFCGIGTMTLMAAQRTAPSGHAVGVELVAASVECARENARRNGIENATFHAGAVESLLGCLTATEPKLATAERIKVIVDPAYKGLADGTAEAIAALPVKRLVYVACSPKNFARDAERFIALGFTLRSVTPVDLFPGAMHLETVGVLERA